MYRLAERKNNIRPASARKEFNKIMHKTLLRLALCASVSAVSLASASNVLAYTVDGGATVTVPGDELSPFQVNGTLNVGYNSSGSLIVGDGTLPGQVNRVGKELYVGANNGSNGYLRIDGAGSSVTGGEDVYIGFRGAGTLEILNGAVLSNDRFWGGLGTWQTGKGTATISGAGSKWIITANMNIGERGEGTLHLVNDGQLIVSNGNGTIIVGSTSTAKGIFNIGADASLAAVAPGTVQARNIQFGTGKGELVLNHTSNNYILAPNINGNGLVSVYNGTTILTGNATHTGGTNIHAGFLQIGDGGTTGSITGNIANNSQLAFNRSNAVTYGGVISGTGTLEQKGTGTLTLTGENTFTGLTTISAGTLQLGSGGASGSLKGNIKNDSRLTINRSDSLVLSSVISGTGVVEQIGSGITELTGANSYTGGTLITNGTLSVGADNALGNVNSGITINGGALQFKNAFALSASRSIALQGNGSAIDTLGHTIAISQAISGSGSLIKTGSGELILTGDNTYSGQTIIALGTLRIGNGTTSGSVSGNIINNGNLAFSRADDYTYTGVISGLGNVIKDNAGTLILTGENTYFGPTLVSGGQIQLGNGGTTGSLKNNAQIILQNNAAIAFNRSDAFVFDGNVSGAGIVEQLGPGTLELTNVANSYSGGTILRGGVLQVSQDEVLGAPSGAIVFDGGALRFAKAFDLNAGRPISIQGGNGTIDTNGFDTTISQAIQGTGSLAKIGAGKLSLAGANTYAGGTALRQGIIGINNGQALGTGTLSLEGGTLQFDADNISFNNPISVANSGTINNGGYIVDIRSTISGNGSINFQNVGVVDLKGSGPFSGQMNLQQGILAVHGNFPGSHVIVNPGTGLMGGSGTIGYLDMRGGVVMPGGTVLPDGPIVPPIGTLHVSGDARFSPDSTYWVEVNAQGQSDLIKVGGTADLGGASLAVLPVQGNYAPETRYTILSANGGVTGHFGSVDTVLAFLTPTVTQDNNNVYLTLSIGGVTPPQPGPNPGPNPNFPSASSTKNQGSVAVAVQALGYQNIVFNTVLSGTIQQARAAFDLLSGEIHATLPMISYTENGLARDAVLERLRRPSDMPSLCQTGQSEQYRCTLDPAVFGLWGQALGAWGRTSTDTNGASISRSTGGFVMGADAKLPVSLWNSTARLGVVGGYLNTDVDLRARVSHGTTESFFGGAYANVDAGGLRLSAGGIYFDTSFDTSRTIAVRHLRDYASAKRNAHTVQAFGEIGYKLLAGKGVIPQLGDLSYTASVEPFVNGSAMRMYTDPFMETARAAGLRGFSHEYNIGTTTIGAHFEARFGAPYLSRADQVHAEPIALRLSLGWRAAFGDLDPTTVMATNYSLAMPSTFAPFPITSVPLDRGALVADAAIDWNVTDSWRMGIAYTAQTGRHATDQALKGRIDLRF